MQSEDTKRGHYLRILGAALIVVGVVLTLIGFLGTTLPIECIYNLPCPSTFVVNAQYWNEIYAGLSLVIAGTALVVAPRYLKVRGRGRKMVVVLLVVIVAVAGIIGFALFTAEQPHSPGTIFLIESMSLQVPQSQPACQGPLCTSQAELWGTLVVDAKSPLSCLDFYVNGTSEGSTCWDLTSTAFTTTECSGSGNQTSCTLVVNNNTNTETSRILMFEHQIFNGTNGTPLIFAGKTYQITLVGEFQDGSSFSESVFAVATISTDYTVSTVSGTVATGS